MAVELALAGYPGATLTTMPAAASPYGGFEPGYVDRRQVPHTAVLADGTRVAIAPAERTRELAPVPEPPVPAARFAGTVVRAPLGAVAAARSGDKGGDANIGVWVRTDEHWAWLAGALTTDELRRMLPETAGLPIERTVLPGLRAVNFVIHGLLGKGVAYGARFDPQAKGLAEWLRSLRIDMPETVAQSATATIEESAP